MSQAIASTASNAATMVGSVAAGPLSTGLLGISTLAIAAGLLVSADLAIATAVCGLADLLPIAMAGVLRSRQAFALAWLAAAAFRLPIAFVLASLFSGHENVAQALPFVYLLSLLVSAGVTVMILRAHEEAAAR